MPGFDISDLVRFDPPRFQCEKCRAIGEPRQDRSGNRGGTVWCSVCRVEYISTRQYQSWEFDRYLKCEAGTGIEFSDPIAHGRTLAEIAGRFGRFDYHRSDLHTLYDLLLAARSFYSFFDSEYDTCINRCTKINFA